MTQVEMIMQLCEQNHVKISKLEKTLGFSNGYIKNLKNQTLSLDRLTKVADYFGLPVDYFNNSSNFESLMDKDISIYQYRLLAQYEKAEPNIKKAIELILKM